MTTRKGRESGLLGLWQNPRQALILPESRLILIALQCVGLLARSLLQPTFPNFKKDRIMEAQRDAEASSSATAETGIKTPVEGDTYDGEPTTLDEESAIKALTEKVRDQDDLERDITRQAEQALIDSEDKRDEKRIEKLKSTKAKLEEQKKAYEQRLTGTASRNLTLKAGLEREVARCKAELDVIDKDIEDFQNRINQRHRDPEDTTGVDTTSEPGKKIGNQRLPNETRREFLIRTGKITPFAKIGGPRPEGVEGDLADVIQEAEEEAIDEGLAKQARSDEPKSHQILRLPGFTEGHTADSESAASGVETEFSLRPRKKRRIQPAAEEDEAKGDEDEWLPQDSVESNHSSASGDDTEDDVDLTHRTRPSERKKQARSSRKHGNSEETADVGSVDDGNEAVYKQRLEDWVRRRSSARNRRREMNDLPAEGDDDHEEEWFKPSPDGPDHVFENGLKLPGDIYPSLFGYQKTAVRWLAELYDIKVGGIVGDEMGLGKTGKIHLFSTI